MTDTNTPAVTPSGSTAQIGLLLSHEADFSPTLTLGSDLPKERNGFECHYRDKESLKPARLTDARGNLWNLTPQTMDEIVSDVNLALSRGHEPPIQDDHYRPTKNFGWIKGVKKNSRGGIDLVHQFLGADSRDEALKRKTSIMLIPNFTDEKGNKYKWFLDHQASVLRPQFRDLEDFKPTALAASNGQPVEAVSLTLASPIEASPQGEKMDLSFWKGVLGDAAKDKPDDQVLALAVEAWKSRETKLTELTTALALSAQDAANQREANGVLVGELEEAESARDKAVLALSAEPEPAFVMDPRVKSMMIDNVAGQRELALSSGVTPAMAKLFDALLNGTDGEPSELALSASGPKNHPFAFLLWKTLAQVGDNFIKTQNGVPRGSKPVEKTPAQLALSAEGEAEQPATEEAIAKSRQDWNLPQPK